MRGNAQKLYCILALSVLLLSMHAVRAASMVYDVVSPGTLQPGSLIPPLTEPVVLTVPRDGQYMSIRNKGPLWVVYPRHTFPELEQAKHNSKWIWQLKEIVLR